MYQANVVGVTDGDTFRIHNGEWIRIANFDAPEKGQWGYEQASQKLISLIHRRWVVLDEKRRDVYGRIVADVYLDGILLRNLL